MKPCEKKPLGRPGLRPEASIKVNGFYVKGCVDVNMF
jgi:hypothetical protein